MKPKTQPQPSSPPPNFTCPGCHKPNRHGFTGVGTRLIQPKPGDILVCDACAEVIVYDPDPALIHLADIDEIGDLSEMVHNAQKLVLDRLAKKKPLSWLKKEVGKIKDNQENQD